MICQSCGEETTGKFCQNCGQLVKTKDDADKKNTVEKLYGLRAGLSVISKFSDEEEKIELPYVRKVEKEEEISRKEYELNFKKGERDNLKRSVNCEIKPPLKSGDSLKSLILMISVAAVLIVLISVGIFSSNYIVKSITLSVAFLVMLLGGTWSIICFVSDYKDDKKRYEKECNWKIEQIAKLKELEREIPNLTLLIPQIKSDAEEGRRMIKYYRKDYSEKSRFVFEALEQTYVQLLDPRDWQHLDLIIFYMETGRAETMKEALQLVDRQIQTDSIVEAIERASKQICSTIQRGMERINNTIVASAQTLSAQINAVSNQLTDLSITADEMQYALKDKANISSKQLMDDVHQMRILADNEEVRRRNS